MDNNDQQNAINKLIADEKELTRQGVVLDFVKARVDTLDKKFDLLLDKMDGKYALKEELRVVKDIQADHEIRIRTDEHFRWQIVGGLVSFQAVADYVLYMLLHK